MNVTIVSSVSLDADLPSGRFLNLIVDTLTKQSIQVSLVTKKQLISNHSQPCTIQQYLTNLFDNKGIDRLYLVGEKAITRDAKIWCEKKRVQFINLDIENDTKIKKTLQRFSLPRAIKFIYASLQVVTTVLFNASRSSSKIIEQPLCVWVYNDGKPGHKNQLRGLLLELKKHTLIKVKWIDVNSTTLSLFDTIKKLKQHRSKVDIVLGAGHKTHIPMLLACAFTGAKSIVLMKPSLPINWFDLAFIPKHDNVNDKPNVITTNGVLNTIKPCLPKNPNAGLILLGGPSKHFAWDDKSLIKQISYLIESQPNINWNISSSRRTPKSFMALLQLLPGKINIITHDETPVNWVSEKLALAAQTWVSEDSSSMLFEALTSGTNVGTLELTSLKQGRLQHSIKQLIDDKRITSFKQWQHAPIFPLNNSQLHEASRCANLMMDYIIDDRQVADHYPSTA